MDELNINSVKAINHGYKDGSPSGTDALKDQRDRVKGYLLARLPKVGRDPSQFQVYEMRVMFYFGAGERLIDYKIQTHGDW